MEEKRKPIILDDGTLSLRDPGRYINMRTLGRQRHHDARTRGQREESSEVMGWGGVGGAKRKHLTCVCDCGHQAHWTDPRGQPVALSMQCATLGTAALSGGHLLRKGKMLQVEKDHQDKIMGGCARLQNKT